MSKRNLLTKAPGTGKFANDRNQPGKGPPTQKNEPRRSPESRQDRLTQVGGTNQVSMRRGGRPSGGQK